MVANVLTVAGFTTSELSLLVSVELVELAGEGVGVGVGEGVAGTGKPLTSGVSQSVPMGAAEVRMVKRVKMRTATVKVETERDIVARVGECGLDWVTGDQTY